MTQSPISSVGSSRKSKFVSCIRINGVPILPPLITAEKRKELRRLKREAIKVEKRLIRERELKAYVAQLYQSCSTNFGDAFENFENIEYCTSKECQTTPVINSNRTHLIIENNINLTDIQPQSESFADCIDQTNGFDQDSNTNEAPALFHDDDEINTENYNEKTEDNHKKVVTPHKLIRSNSYTLDTPSPALVEFLKTSKAETQPTTCWELELSLPQPDTPRSEMQEDADTYSHVVDTSQIYTVAKHLHKQTESNMTFTKDISLADDLQITSIDATPHNEDIQNGISARNDDYNDVSVSEEYIENELNSSRTETELRNLSDCESHLQDFIVNNIPTNNVNNEYQDVAVITPGETDIPESPKNEWDNILKQIPSAYSRQILVLLERQQMSQNLTHEISDAFEEIQHNPEKYSTPHDVSMKSQSDETVYYSANQENSKIKMSMSERTFYADKRDLYGRAVKYEGRENEDKLRLELASWKRTCAIDSGHQDESRQVKLGRNEAAIILTAAARGFLVRRLMQTEKVQHLIQTIKEAVMCAMQLHHDTLEHIEEADVELHRRLIQQVTAACDSFHNVFFTTSIQDQMSFIAADRQKKVEKQRRITSASSNVSLRSNKSTRSSSSLSTGRKKLLRS